MLRSCTKATPWTTWTTPNIMRITIRWPICFPVTSTALLNQESEATTPTSTPTITWMPAGEWTTNLNTRIKIKIHHKLTLKLNQSRLRSMPEALPTRAIFLTLIFLNWACLTSITPQPTHRLAQHQESLQSKQPESQLWSRCQPPRSQPYPLWPFPRPLCTLRHHYHPELWPPRPLRLLPQRLLPIEICEKKKMIFNPTLILLSIPFIIYSWCVSYSIFPLIN